MKRSKGWAVAAVLAVIVAIGASGVSAYASGVLGGSRALRAQERAAGKVAHMQRWTEPSAADLSARLRTPVQPRATAYPLPALPVTGTLDAGHLSDFYYLYLAAGQSVTLYLEGDPGTDFDLGLLDTDENLVAASIATDYPELILYKVPAGKTGVHFVWVNRYTGDGSYELKYGVDTDSEVPGAILRFPPSTVGGMLDSDTDLFDAHSVYLFAGQTLTAVLDGAGGSDFDLALYPPGTTSQRSTQWVADTFASTDYPDTLTYVAPTTGTYYLVARTWLDTGSGWYRFSWSRAWYTGTFRPTLSVSATRLRRGQRMTYRGAVLPASMSRKRPVTMQVYSGGRWRNAFSLPVDSAGRYAGRAPVVYWGPYTLTIRAYMPAYKDYVRGISYRAGYSAPRTVRWY